MVAVVEITCSITVFTGFDFARLLVRKMIPKPGLLSGFGIPGALYLVRCCSDAPFKVLRQSRRGSGVLGQYQAMASWLEWRGASTERPR